MDSHQMYTYSPLEEPLTIRTIHLLVSNSDELECTVTHGRLDEIKYQCLSYVWGNPEKRNRIIVKDSITMETLGSIPLTHNLFTALKDLRNCAEVKHKVFWIDQICIHQENNAEKGLQVALMGDIYRHASAVILYLGPSGPFDELGLELIEQLYNHFKPSLQPILEMSWYFAYRRSDPLPVEKLPDSVTILHPGWPALLDMAFGAWTERSWIVQENVVNQNTFMLRGQKKLDWVAVASLTLFFGVGLLPIALLDDIRKHKNQSLDCYIDAVSRSLEIRLKNLEDSSPETSKVDDWLTIRENFDWYDALECADPRDHVYSILALSTDVKKLGIVPDYNQPVEAVFVDLTVRILQYYQSFEHLFYVSLLDNLSYPTKYPSWSLTPHLLGRQHYLEYKLYRAHPSVTTQFNFNESRTELTVKGQILCRVVFASSGRMVQGSTFWGVSPEEKVYRLFEEMLALTKCLYHVGVTEQKIGQLLVAMVVEKFRDSAGHDVRVDLTHSMFCYLRWCWIEMIMLEDKLSDDARAELPFIADILSDVYGIANRHDELNLSVEEVKLAKKIDSQKCTYGRSFGATQSGYIVNFTHKAEVGDQIALLQGGTLPYVLRPQERNLEQDGDRYQFVGDACIAKIMFGEVYRTSDPDQVDYDIKLV